MAQKYCHHGIDRRIEGYDAFNCIGVVCSLWDNEREQCSELTRNLAMYSIQKLLKSLKILGRL